MHFPEPPQYARSVDIAQILISQIRYFTFYWVTHTPPTHFSKPLSIPNPPLGIMYKQFYGSPNGPMALARFVLADQI